MGHWSAYNTGSMDDIPPTELDAVSAHLDRGWSLYGKGDLPGARVSAEHVLHINGDIPDGYLLLGAVAAAEGDQEEALDLMNQAMDLEPEFIEPVLYAAEIYVHRLGDIDAGLDLCRRAEALAAQERDRLDIRLLRIEAALMAGDTEGAAGLADGFPPGPFDDPVYDLRWGKALLEVERFEDARALLEGAAAGEATSSDACYYQALALEGLGDAAGCADRLLDALLADEQTPEPPWSADPEIFDRVVAEAMGSLDGAVADLIEGVPVTVRELPPAELVCEDLDPRALVYFSGAITPPQPEAGHTVVRRIFIYKRNAERPGLDAAELAADLRRAIEDEARYFLDTTPE